MRQNPGEGKKKSKFSDEWIVKILSDADWTSVAKAAARQISEQTIDGRVGRTRSRSIANETQWVPLVRVGFYSPSVARPGILSS